MSIASYRPTSRRCRVTKRSHRLANGAVCGINTSMIASRARFYFWYYAFPMPLAEEGLRSG